MLEVRRVLVPIDFSRSSVAALRYAVQFARAFGATVEALHVCSVPDHLLGTIAIAGREVRSRGADDFVRDEARRQLDELVRHEGSRSGVDVMPRVTSGDPTDEIVHSARASGCDLVIMGTHGRTGLAYWLVGSVAQAVLRRCRCPVLTIRSAYAR